MKRSENSMIDDLKRQLSTVQKASLMASKLGDYAKSATLAAQAVQISKTIAREEGLPPVDFFTADEAVYA
jgi:hypothetical protein